MPSTKQDFYVYILFDWRGIPRYVGKGRGNRWMQHRRKDQRSKLKSDFMKRTMSALGDIPTIKVREYLSEQDAFVTEITLIKAIGRINLHTGTLTNYTNGGSGGITYQWTAAQRAAQSIRSKGNQHVSGRIMSAEEIKQRRIANTGKIRSLESRARMSTAQVGNKNALGHTVSEETRNKISIANSGRIFSFEHRAKLSAKAKGNQRRLGKTHSVETRAKISRSKRQKCAL